MLWHVGNRFRWCMETSWSVQALKRKKKKEQYRKAKYISFQQSPSECHPGLKNCLAYESKVKAESNNGSISCLISVISDIIKHIWFHLIFIKVPKKRQEPWLMYIAVKEEEGNFINHFFLISLLLCLTLFTCF